MTNLPYQPPTLSSVGSLQDLTLANQAGIGLDVFACVSGLVVANAAVSTGGTPVLGIDIIVGQQCFKDGGGIGSS